MKKMLLLPLVLIMLSCSGKSGEPISEKGEATIIDNTATANNGEVAKEKEVPSLYTLEPATEEDFRKAVSGTTSFTMNKGDARKINGAITLKINGEWKSIEALKDTLIGTDNTEQAEYKYLGQNKELNKYLVAGYFYEHYETYLVDKTTGEIAAATWTEPSVSPDLRFLANVSLATVMEPTSNGIQVWKVTKNGATTAIEKYFEINQQDWEAFEMKWETPRSIIIKIIPMEQFEMLTGEPKQNDFSYMRLRIK
jgi:hypothetical protein